MVSAPVTLTSLYSPFQTRLPSLYWFTPLPHPPVHQCSIQSPVLYNHSMPAQTSLCRLRGAALNSSCGGVNEPPAVEMTFTPHLGATASTAIWQSHQERFTCLTFTCLHAVNTTFLLLWTSPSLSDVRRGRRGGKNDISAGKHVPCVYKHTRYGISHTAGGAQLPSSLAKFTTFSKMTSWLCYQHVCLHKKAFQLSAVCGLSILIALWWSAVV